MNASQSSAVQRPSKFLMNYCTGQKALGLNLDSLGCLKNEIYFRSTVFCRWMSFFF